MSTTYAAFTEKEHRGRLEQARETLRRHGIACCVSVAPEHLYYFAGYDSWVSVNSPQALIFMPDGGEPTLIVRDVDLALPRETSWVTDIRTYHLFTDDVAALIAAVVEEKGFRGGRIGIETQTYALPYSLGRAIAEALAPAELVDATDVLGQIRLVKSPQEMKYLRSAARFAQLGLDAARKTLRPGLTEIDLAAAIESAMRSAGSDYWSIPTELASGSRTAGGHATPRDRVIEAGDLVHLDAWHGVRASRLSSASGGRIRRDPRRHLRLDRLGTRDAGRRRRRRSGDRVKRRCQHLWKRGYLRVARLICSAASTDP